MINVREEYRKNRKDFSAKDSWSIAKNAIRKEFEQKLRGFEFLEWSQMNNGYASKVLLDGEEYEARVEYDQDYDAYEGGDVEILNTKPYSGQYAREQVVAVNDRRDSRWLLLSEDPKERARWYSKRGDSRQVAYEKGAASCVKSLEYYRRIYENGTDSYCVLIEKNGDMIDSCGGIEEDYIEDFVWEALS